MGPPNKADQKDPRTLFIRGVDFAIDEKKLEEVFSDIGPVRTCFLVREKGKETHKGFGFVQFALQEDAERAVQDLNNRTVGGKKLQVSCASGVGAQFQCSAGCITAIVPWALAEYGSCTVTLPSAIRNFFSSYSRGFICHAAGGKCHKASAPCRAHQAQGPGQ